MSIQENSKDYSDLKMAVELLESPSIIARISNVIGSPIEGVTKRLPMLLYGVLIMNQVNQLLPSFTSFMLPYQEL